jgi:adenosylmethionine-8-amino-7-oxononanoate aminotransferase
MDDDPKLPAKIGAACREAGVFVRPLVDGAIAVSPPLIFGDAELKELAEGFRTGLDAVA